MSGFSATMELLEPTFGLDLNGDGVTGAITTTIAAAGAITLLTVGDQLSFRRVGGLAAENLRRIRRRWPIRAWTPLGAEQAWSNYQVVWKNGGADQYFVWTTDGNGNFLSQGAVLSGTSLTLESLETTFNQNFNGDGRPVLSRPTSRLSARPPWPRSANTDSLYAHNTDHRAQLKISGAPSRSAVADTYSLNDHGATTGPQLKLSGAAVTVGQFGAWTPLGAEQTGSNDQIVWKNGGADEYVVWTTDINGNFLSQSAVLSRTERCRWMRSRLISTRISTVI